MELMEIRRALMSQHPIRVCWNQYAPALNADNYAPYDTNNIDVAYANNMATITWKKDIKEYRSCIRSNELFYPTVGDKWYCSTMYYPSKIGTYKMYNPGLRAYSEEASCEANIWTRISNIGEATTATQTSFGYFPYRWSSASGITGETCAVKAYIFINLTQMFGVGNEPDLETFEEQCAKNGIDLTAYHPKDISGTQRMWYL